jgi:predicted TPR repeat methyltransferase
VTATPFDVVLAAWLLPYAPDVATLTIMLNNVANNLKDGGYFVSVINPLADDPRTRIEQELHVRPAPV